uniref:Uncharacterized protein n=2 Tax=Picea TaxID=3328 RepID=A0A101LXW3_PICGL|nr:hypothetical protein ABT39_MTgene5520 [Picea glauca]QHR91585.1 hypothetical protein Q903MT_gene5620 [Picea sitchensis]
MKKDYQLDPSIMDPLSNEERRAPSLLTKKDYQMDSRHDPGMHHRTCRALLILILILEMRQLGQKQYLLVGLRCTG